MKKRTSRWIFYNIVVCFAVYWLSNFIVWYPWSVDETLGQTLMFIINPLLWGFASYSCIVRYPMKKTFNGTLLNSLIFIVEAIAWDLIFFGVIRNVMHKLMQPTTFYAWGFVVFIPFIIYFLLGKLIKENRNKLLTSDFVLPLIIGLVSFVVIIVILSCDVQFS